MQGVQVKVVRALGTFCRQCLDAQNGQQLTVKQLRAFSTRQNVATRLTLSSFPQHHIRHWNSGVNPRTIGQRQIHTSESPDRAQTQRNEMPQVQVPESELLRFRGMETEFPCLARK